VECKASEVQRTAAAAECKASEVRRKQAGQVLLLASAPVVQQSPLKSSLEEWELFSLVSSTP